MLKLVIKFAIKTIGKIGLKKALGFVVESYEAERRKREEQEIRKKQQEIRRNIIELLAVCILGGTIGIWIVSKGILAFRETTKHRHSRFRKN